MKRLFLIFVFLVPLVVDAQTLKTGVLVIGHGDSAFAAGVQASESGVNTTVLTLEDGFDLTDFRLKKANGVINTFHKRAHKYLNLADSLPLPNMTRQINNAIIKKWADSSKLFKVINQVNYTELKRTGSGWELKLSNGQAIRAKALIMATDADRFFKFLKVQNLKKTALSAFTYDNTLYRTAVMAHSDGKSFLPFDHLLIPEYKNLFYIEPDDLEIGQATGATAAFPVFFDTKIDFSHLKKIQIEVLTYKLALMPFDDIAADDHNWLAIQKVGNTGVLKGVLDQGQLLFKPEQKVTMEELKQPIKEYYYKANIWFEDQKDRPLDLERAISLVSVLGNKSPETTAKTLEKNWNSVYKFPSKFDLKKEVTRREFAVLASDFLQVFDQSRVNQTGRILR